MKNVGKDNLTPLSPSVGSGDPSPFSHTCVSVAGNHLNNSQIDSRQKHAGMTGQIPDIKCRE